MGARDAAAGSGMGGIEEKGADAGARWLAALRTTRLTRRVGAIATLAVITAGAAAADVRVRFATDLGDFDAWLLDSEAPFTVANFLAYADQGAYDTDIFHRLIPGFVLQGGGFDVSPEGVVSTVPTHPPVQNEFGRSNVPGTLAMARLPGQPDSATSQFFVNLADNGVGSGVPDNLDTVDGGFAVFGCAVDPSLAVPRAIEALTTVNLSGSVSPAWTDVPVEQYTEGVPVAPDDLVHVQVSRVVDGLPEPGCPACQRKAKVAAVAKLAIPDAGRKKQKRKLVFRFFGDHWTARGGDVDLRGTLQPVGSSGRKFDLVPDACGAAGLGDWLSALGSGILGSGFRASSAEAIPSLRAKLDRKRTKWKVSAEIAIVGSGGEASGEVEGVFRLEGVGRNKPLE